ncbi:MAG TPA: PEP-CTERM sorting domain-containing protein [Candidatus Acidoferrum sp.]|nr:PEP-CTERM sorting domain-containing protein [Candidatus Acidoferrum sp.]
MKILTSCLVAALFALIFASPARADSTEFAISINGSWQQNQFCLSLCTSSSRNPIVDTFSATFDVYANGTMVPGTMQFTFTDSSFLTTYGASPLSFGPPPACEPAGASCGEGFPGGTSLPGQQMWSDSQGYFVDFVPPTWPPTGLESFSATQTVPSSVFGETTLGLDCVGEPGSEGCAPFLFCYDIDCAGGGDAPASSGFITISPLPVKTPEPGVLVLLLSGALLCFIRRRCVADAN